MTDHTVAIAEAQPSEPDSTDAVSTELKAPVAERSAPRSDTPGVVAPLSPAQRRRHPALGARIAATGLSTTAMLGIVAGLGIANPPTQASDESVPVATVVVDPAPAGTSTATIDRPSSDSVTLTTNPVIRVEAPAPSAAPIARTSGSR